jgi:hypothetical protein
MELNTWISRMGSKVGKRAAKTKKAAKTVKKAVALKKAKKALKPVSRTLRSPVPERVAPERVLKKLPPAKPMKVEQPVVRIFGHAVDSRKVRDSAVEAYGKRLYTIDDIAVDQFISEKEWDNLMTKIGILDRIEEQLIMLYPHIDVVRKNKITLELYVK